MAGIHNLTASTRLCRRDSGDLMDYFLNWRTPYGIICRYTWYHYAAASPRPRKSAFNTELQKVFGVTKRTANSVIYDMTGRFHALQELKKKECSQMRIKIAFLKETADELRKSVSRRAAKADGNRLSEEELIKYRKEKTSLYYKTQELNKKKMQLSQLEKDMREGKYRICFGGRKRFGAQNRLAENGYRSQESWYKDYTCRRDCVISYLGSKDESGCNQMLQLAAQEDGSFRIKCRKDGIFAGSKEDRYVYGTCRFPYLGDRLREQLKDQGYGITYRVCFKGKKVYLQAILSFEEPAVKETTMHEGAIGLDYNDGFIQLAQTDRAGNLVDSRRYSLSFHGTGKKAENEIRQAVAEICKYSLQAGKSIVCEDLDFYNTKSRIQKGKRTKGKRYNRMIHLLDYARYKETLRNAAVRNNIDLVMVNPAYTSQIARKKYCGRRKLNIHCGAAYVIARRGQGLKEKKPA